MSLKQERIVIKAGTTTLTNELGNSNLHRMEELALAISDIQNMGHEVILVSSGAIAVGEGVGQVFFFFLLGDVLGIQQDLGYGFVVVAEKFVVEEHVGALSYGCGRLLHPHAAGLFLEAHFVGSYGYGAGGYENDLMSHISCL